MKSKDSADVIISVTKKVKLSENSYTRSAKVGVFCIFFRDTGT